jgi:hypothetical protein
MNVVEDKVLLNLVPQCLAKCLTFVCLIFVMLVIGCIPRALSMLDKHGTTSSPAHSDTY